MNTWHLFMNPIKAFLPKIPEAILTFMIGYLVMHLAIWVIGRILVASRMKKSLVEVISSILLIFFWIILIASVLKNIGLNQLALTISGSVLVLGLAFANGAKNLTDDIISGIFLAKDHDFSVGDQIKIGDLDGIVEKIDLKKCRLRDKNQILHILPNSKIEHEGWTVLKKG